jgi:hypothetical protein
MRKIALLFGGLLLIIYRCAPEDPIPVDPGVALLISPVNNETCLDGTSLNDTQSNVSFSWSAASDTRSYEIIISNLLTQSSQTYTSVTNQTSVALSKEEPYSWYVKSIGEEGSTPSESEQWKFYLAGDATINYAPFPSELIAPRSGVNITPDIDKLVIFSWNAADVDGDLERFEVYLDQTDASTLNSTLDYQSNETSIELEVENDATYYWKIIAIDANGNQSSSGVYSFRTN